MEAAAIIAIILLDYVDFALIIALLLINSTIGECRIEKYFTMSCLVLTNFIFLAFWEEYSSGNAITALQAQLTPTCKVSE